MSVVRSKAVILSSFIQCSVGVPLCVGRLVCSVLLGVLSNLSIIDAAVEIPCCF